MSFWYDEIYMQKTRFGIWTDRKLVERRSDFQKIEVIETEQFGRVLAIDEIFMTSEKDEHLYHEMLVHPAMTTAPRIERVLIIGGGDGGTAREVLSYPEVKEVVLVEIDEAVVEVSKAYLPTIGTAWDDSRLKILIDDGVEYAKTALVAPFDLIFLDGTDPVGPAKGLFTAAFYRGCERLLAPDGVFALQSESPILMRDVFLELGQTLGSVFPKVYPYFGPVPIYASGTWSWTYATRTADPKAICAERVQRTEGRTKYYNRDIHRAAFTLPNDLRAIFCDGAVNLP